MKNLIFCTAILLLASCGGGQKKAAVQTQGERIIPEFDLSEPSKAAIGEKLTWNDLAKNIRVIPLETNDASLLGGLCTIKAVTGGHIALFSQNVVAVGSGYMFNPGDPVNAIVIFGRDGKHELTLRRQGKGGASAMEYLRIDEAVFIEEPFTIRIYDGMQNAFLDYDRTGKGVSFKLREEPRMRYPEFPIAINDDYYFDIDQALPLYNRNEILTLRGYDGSSKVFLSIDAPLHPDAMNGRSLPVAVSKYRDGALAYMNLGDTVYKVTGDGMEEFARIKRGSYSFDEGIYRVKLEDNREVLKSSICVENFVNAGEYYCMAYELQDFVYAEIWKDGESKPVVRRAADSKSASQLFNISKGLKLDCTIQGGTIPLTVIPDYADGDKFYFLVEAHKLTDIIPGIEEDDNQVLIEMEF